jgi:hypothetical protein
LRIELELVGDITKQRRIVGFENSLIQRPGKVGIINPVKYVSQRVVFGKDRFVQGRACVSGLQNRNLDVVLLFETL